MTLEIKNNIFIKMEGRIATLSTQNIEYERTNDILTKENQQLVKAVDNYEKELDNVLREKEMIKAELDQTLQALNEI